MSDIVERIKTNLDNDESLEIGGIRAVERDVHALAEGRNERIQKKILSHLKQSPEKFLIIDIYDSMIHFLYRKDVVVKIEKVSNNQLYRSEKDKTYLISVLFDYTPANVAPEKAYRKLKQAGSVIYTIENIEDVDFAFYEFDERI